MTAAEATALDNLSYAVQKLIAAGFDADAERIATIHQDIESVIYLRDFKPEEK